MKKSFAAKKKKNSVKFCSKTPLGPTGKEFWLEYNVSIFAQMEKYSAEEKKKKKKTWLYVVRKCP